MSEQDNIKISKAPRTKAAPLLTTSLTEQQQTNEIIEIGVDEVGRGPLFGRVYTAAVILPKDGLFDHSKMKDSKKFHSKKKMVEVAEYIKEERGLVAPQHKRIIICTVQVFHLIIIFILLLLRMQ